MLAVERNEKIKAYIYENKYASIDELAELFGISTATVRRCLKQLEEEKMIENVRGGAIIADGGAHFEQPYLLKKQSNIEEKRRIAKEAVNHISSNDSIFMDSSSTVCEMVNFIPQLENVSVSTNDVAIAGALTNIKGLDVMVTGGKLRGGYYTVMGYFAESVMEQIRVDTLFFSVDAISEEGNFMITNSEEVGVKRGMFKVARRKIALCDHTKFGMSSFVNLWDFQKVDLVITGKELDDRTYERYTELGMNIVRV